MFNILWILLHILVIIRSYDETTQIYHDVKQNFDRWVIELSQSFNELQTVSAEPYLKSIYKTENFESKVINETIATGYLQTALEKIQNIVNEKSKLVDNIKIAAEEAFVNRDGNEPIGCYYRAKALTIVPPLNETDNCSVKFYIPLKQSPQHDNQYVCYNFSVAHVPTNVYDLSDKLKRIGNWTTELDKVFKLNANLDPTLKWQYFGSSTGFFRYYPGAMWEIQLDEYRLDFFDCRSQPWYLQASAYPKEMIILIDKSGSMKGRSDIISNATAAEILNTLTENDYFNVMMFSDNTMYADRLITDRLVQATKYNKDKMIKTFRKFTPNGTASYENAITEVFRLFNKVDENFHTDHKCNRMIMIITDSAPGSYEHLFKEFNPQKYLDVIARSNALQDDAYFVWTGATIHQFNFKKLKRENFTNPYLMNTPSSRSFMNGFVQNMLMEPDPVRIDTMIASKEELPKMYTSVAKAVYDKTNKAKRLKEGNLLGVAGIDVPLQSFQDALRGWKIGVNNYLFAVDNNGFVLFHPNYRPVYKALLKSYYQNVDINEVEVMKEVKIDPWSGTPEYNTTLRNAMINRERTSVDMDVNVVVDNYHTTFEVNKKFFISPIDQTPFTLGLAIQWDPSNNKGYPIPEYRFNSQELFSNLHVNDFSCFAPKYSEQNSNCNSHGNDSQIGSTIIPYEFCQFNKDLASLYLKDRLCAFRHILLNSSLINRLKCDEEYLSRIYLDAKLTCDLSNYWFKQSKSHLITKWKIQQAFSFHHSGLIRFYNFTTPAYPHFITDHIDGVEDSLYSETIQTSRYLSEDNVLVFHAPPNDLFRHFSSEKLDVPITLTTSVFREPIKAPMGIVGLQITHSAIQNEFNRITNTCFTGECHVCGSPGLDCYIINQAAMVLVSNVGEKEVGQNLKEINCALVEDLVNRSILNETYLYDFQGICIETVQETFNAGNHLYPPFQFILKIILWFVNETVLFIFGFVNLLSYRIVNGQKWSIYSEPEESIAKAYPDTLSSYQSRNPPEDFMVHQNLMYYGIDEEIKNRNSPYHNLPDQHTDASSQVNNPIQSHIYTREKQPFDDNQKLINNELHNDHNQDKSIIRTSKTTQITSTSLHNQSDINLITESILVPELKEESIDGLFGRIDQDPYDAHLRALTAIETCRKEQIAHIQSILDSQSENTITNNTADEFINYTESTTAIPINLGPALIGKGGKLVPGSLLACVHRSVQQRCHSGAGTSSYTGRYACEAICEVVRERMPQLANRLEDCKQPLTPCTERFVTYNVVLQNLKKNNDVTKQVTATHDISPISGVSNVNDFTGEYCNECGGRRWLMKRIPKTNLFLLINIVLSGSQSIQCKCNCRKQFRYGARLVNILFFCFYEKKRFFLHYEMNTINNDILNGTVV
ncbi:hypothetical protein MN116_007515 [Schistosoma mekongi]|uniref:VWFA domain-containing protein n=1 Tax=Schistosoma mekongi TaxID=38744 RepID=A0AAE1Z886_SCHME|nr:hypothetical protein MN116_007515 [Schistosoma mekongi]